MAYRIGDSFDFYNVIADAVAATRWDSSTAWSLSTTTRFAHGRSMAGNQSSNCLIRTGLTNEDTLFAHVAHIQTAALGSATLNQFIQYRDGATAQCSITFRGDGSIIISNGTPTVGTIQSTFSSAFVANSYDSWQFKVVVHNTLGEWYVRKNGVLVHSATGINTRGGTANDYANALNLGHSSGAVVGLFDDFIHWDDNGGAPFNDWIDREIRAVSLMPNADSSVDLSTQNVQSLTFGRTDTQFTRTLVANRVYFTAAFGAAVGGKFTSSTININGTFTGNMKMALYKADGAKSAFLSGIKPGKLVAVSDVKVNGVNGDNTITWPSDVPVVGGESYCFAVVADANFTVNNRNITNEMFLGTSYAGGFTDDVSGLTLEATDVNSTGGVCYYRAFATITVTNFGVANDMLADGVSSYVFGYTPGDADLYELEDLPFTPDAVLGVVLKSFSAKSDAGGKTMRIAGDSGGTTFETASFSPLTTFGGFDAFYLQDPDTAAQWTPSAVNALKIGPKVQT